MRRHLLAFGGVAALFAWAAACGFDLAGTADPSASPNAATGDGAGGPGEGGSSGIPVGGDASGARPDSASDSAGSADAPPDGSPCTDPLRCLKCSPPLIYCPSVGCVADCKANCPGAPLGCVACQSGDTPSVETCVTQANATTCLGGSNVRCACAGGKASLCPGSHQVCLFNLCRACGEPATDGFKCAGGGGALGCNAIDNPTDQFLCRPCSPSQGCN